jgi:hypothetical protein
MYLPTYIGAFIIMVAGLGAWQWLAMPEENNIIEIMASREPELALPVYAQFTVTQLLTLPREALLHRLEVPVYFPSRESHVTIDLRHEDTSLWRWFVQSDEEGITLLDLPLLSAAPLSGQVEVTFAARDISHDHQQTAPRNGGSAVPRWALSDRGQ